MRGSAGARFDQSFRSFAVKQKCETLLVFSVVSFKVKINTVQQIKSRTWKMKGGEYAKALP